ncbi:MAG TPA: von Willebrand factor type A domain-containing protein [Planctomycetota bacterium]|nr:von Willebrand factor type A domain-containing protein [Planctomycetota bacterium]
MTNHEDHETMVPDGDPRLTAYALGELEGADVAEIEALLARDAAARAEVEAIRASAAELGEMFAMEAAAAPTPELTAAQRAEIESAARAPASRATRRATRRAALTWLAPLAAAAALVVWVTLSWNGERVGKPAADKPVAKEERAGSQPELLDAHLRQLGYIGSNSSAGRAPLGEASVPPAADSPFTYDLGLGDATAGGSGGDAQATLAANDLGQLGYSGGASSTNPGAAVAPGAEFYGANGMQTAKGRSADAAVTGTQVEAPSAPPKTGAGRYSALARDLGGDSAPVPAPAPNAAAEYATNIARPRPAAAAAAPPPADALAETLVAHEESSDDRESPRYRYLRVAPTPGTESYQPIVESGFQSPFTAPYSTFGVDVDTASYSNVRRFLNNGQLPPADAVRIEELLNYFRYDDPAPAAGAECPFGVTVDVTECPWSPSHRLARVALKGREVPAAQRGPTNLVFLLDVSGSMDQPDKLPLLVQSMKLLAQQLDERDRVAIVTYAGAAGLVLDSTVCDGPGRQRVLDALDNLRAGGSTAGAAGIQLAYQVAARNFRQGGTNRVLLATDGDFNVGPTSRDELTSLIESSARTGTFLTVLGFGEGNLKDGTAELLADKGNGQYAYIDSLDEGRRVLVQQMGGTLVTIAKDVKLQLEFNPARVQAYRLIGYENRALAPQDFKDDRKDAGDIGAGHSVVALYELVPPGAETGGGIDALKYQKQPDAPKPELVPSDELLTVKLRWKAPDASASTETDVPVRDGGQTLAMARPDVKFSAAVAGFGMLLRGSSNAGNLAWQHVIALGEAGRGSDPDGWRAEFVRLAKMAMQMQGPMSLTPQQVEMLKSIGYMVEDGGHR